MPSLAHSSHVPQRQGIASQFLPRGTVLGEQFRLDAVLGEGHAGVVYNAWDLQRRRSCAAKVLRPELTALTAALVRLRHDNQMIGKLHHPHLRAGAAKMHVLGNGTPFLVRDLCHGMTLRQRLAHGPLPLPELCRLFLVLCGALEAAHRHGVIHGDLKPENLLLCRPPPPLLPEESWPERLDGPARPAARATPVRPEAPDGKDRQGAADDRPELDETVQVLDFGMHHLRNGGAGIGSHPLLGTVSYLAPEQIQGEEAAVDGRADVFALGLLLYECLTGTPAFEGPHAAAVLAKICHGDAPRPSRVAAVPPGLDGLDVIVEMACHKLPDERFASPSALAIALRDAVAGQAEVAEALRMLRGPSAASSTVVLLPAPQDGPEPAAGEPAPQGDPAGPAIREESDPGVLSRPRKRVALSKEHRRPGNGARAIQLFKELEVSSQHQPRGDPSVVLRRLAAEEAASILDSAAARAAREADRRAAAQQRSAAAAEDARARRLHQEATLLFKLGPRPSPAPLAGAEAAPGPGRMRSGWWRHPLPLVLLPLAGAAALCLVLLVLLLLCPVYLLRAISALRQHGMQSLHSD